MTAPDQAPRPARRLTSQENVELLARFWANASAGDDAANDDLVQRLHRHVRGEDDGPPAA